MEKAKSSSSLLISLEKPVVQLQSLTAKPLLAEGVRPLLPGATCLPKWG